MVPEQRPPTSWAPGTHNSRPLQGWLNTNKSKIRTDHHTWHHQETPNSGHFTTQRHTGAATTARYNVVVPSHHADSKPWTWGHCGGFLSLLWDHSLQPDWLQFGRGWFKVIIFATTPFSWLQFRQGLLKTKVLHKSIFNLSSALLRPTWNIGYSHLLKLMLPFLTK